MAELVVNLETIYNNARTVVNFCKENGIFVTGVVKGCNALLPVVSVFIAAGCKGIGSSRINHLRKLKMEGYKVPLWLLRPPPPSEIPESVMFADVVLVSDLKILEMIEESAKEIKKEVQAILMVDVGDLREGWWPAEDVLTIIPELKKFTYVKIIGIGTNMGCYGGVVPDEKNTGKLVMIAENMRKEGIGIEIISGGATSSLPLLLEKSLPEGVNNLRVGEGILLGRDLAELWNKPFPGVKLDGFVLRAEILEIRTKPSVPEGEIFVDAFGRKPLFVDKGLRKKAVLGVGKADFMSPEFLIPRDEGIEILGASSDHLILDVEDYKGKLKVGDFLEFELRYGGLLGLTASEDVKKVFV